MRKAYLISCLLHLSLLLWLGLPNLFAPQEPQPLQAVVTFEFVSEVADSPNQQPARGKPRAQVTQNLVPPQKGADLSDKLAREEPPAETTSSESSSTPRSASTSLISVGETEAAAGKGLQLSYAQQLKAYIEQHKHYPRAARKLRQSGLVRIQVEIDQNGAFRKVKLLEGSSHPFLNQAAIQLIENLQKFKPLPEDLQAPAEFTIPIAYQLTGADR